MPRELRLLQPLPAPILSEDVQAIIGLAIVDSAFKQLLLKNPSRALAGFQLSAADRQATGAISGARSLAEYAARLEQKLLAERRPKLPVKPRARQHPLPAAS